MLVLFSIAVYKNASFLGSQAEVHLANCCLLQQLVVTSFYFFMLELFVSSPLPIHGDIVGFEITKPVYSLINYLN